MRYVEVFDKARIRLESLDLSLFWYIDQEDKLYLSANPFMREVGKVEFKKAAAICRTSPIQGHFSFMLVGDHQIDLLCVEEEESIDAVLDYMLDDRGWWKKKESVKADVMKVREVLRTALSNDVLESSAQEESPVEPEQEQEREVEVKEEAPEAIAEQEEKEPENQPSSKAIFMTDDLIDKLNRTMGKRESPWVEMDAGNAANGE